MECGHPGNFKLMWCQEFSGMVQCTIDYAGHVFLHMKVNEVTY